jgi:pullulanase/glycogen debranching enzyme
MKKNDDGTWEYTQPQPAPKLIGTYYAYRVAGPAGCREAFNETILFADPYSRAVATKNTVKHESRSLILDPKFDTKYDWQGDKPVIQPNHNSLVIYEAHVRDMTAHASSGVKAAGSYKGLTEQGTKGGLGYLKALGVNAVEFLPLHEFANIEPDFNKYRRNHWGYMTSFYFAPESYYASSASLKSEEWSGIDGRAVKELKDLVKALHRENIAVIMDVVYNHVSEFDNNPLKLIDKFYYFHTDTLCNYVATSYCGNDFKTNRAMARRLIVESIKYWMTEYHVDGFRFDLATMIDKETCEEILREARKINPNVVIIAEPWGGNKYGPAQFSDISWAAWNDQIRNGVKGQNPRDGMGFIFGRHQGKNTKRSLQSFITGTLREDGGLFLKKEHSINYLESHDDETMGDFIRMGLRENREDEPVKNLEQHVKSSPKQIALNKLAAMFLFSAQGPIMLHAGQEYARSKVIAAMWGIVDADVGRIDRNSYNKDNETNYLNYAHAAKNQDLIEYYKGLIALRKLYPNAFGSASKQAIEFLETGKEFAIACRITNTSNEKGSQPASFIVLLNGERETPLQFTLPKGAWKVIGNAERISPAKPLQTLTGTATIPQSSGMILAE